MGVAGDEECVGIGEDGGFEERLEAADGVLWREITDVYVRAFEAEDLLIAKPEHGGSEELRIEASHLHTLLCRPERFKTLLVLLHEILFERLRSVRWNSRSDKGQDTGSIRQRLTKLIE